MPSNRQAERIISQCFNGERNFMTPHQIECRLIHPRLAAELSSGEGMNHQQIFGVTFARVEKDGSVSSRWRRLSKCFHSIDAAEAYMDRVKSLARTLAPNAS